MPSAAVRANILQRKQFDPILGGGNVAYCSPSGKCHAATSNDLKFPNGLAKGADGLIYVPSTIDGKVRAYELQPDKSLKHIDTVELRMPLDNLALDANGDFWVAGGPDLVRTMKWVQAPMENPNPSTVLRIKKTKDGYQVDKILEDGETKVFNGLTTARHDAKTGKLFLGGEYLSFKKPRLY